MGLLGSQDVTYPYNTEGNFQHRELIFALALRNTSVTNPKEIDNCVLFSKIFLEKGIENYQSRKIFSLNFYFDPNLNHKLFHDSPSGGDGPILFSRNEVNDDWKNKRIKIGPN